MSALLIEMNRMAAVGLAALLNTLWYAGAVVALTWLGLRYAPRVNAATRYWIWMAALGFLFLLPFLPGLAAQARIALASPERAGAAVQPLATVPAPPASVRQLAPVTLAASSVPGSNSWPLWLLAAWIFAAAWQLTRLLAGVTSVRRLKGRAEIAQTGALPVHLRRRVDVMTSADVGSPVAVGYAHPAVIIPPGLLARLDEGERQNVLLHELAHLARYDDWMALATRALGALLILHPLAAIVLGRVEREREMACDDFVVARTGSPRSYARSLARLHDLRWSTGTRLLASGLLGRNSSLGDRIESLLRRGREFSARPSLASLSVSALLLALLLGAGGLIPGWIAIAQSRTALPKSFEVASIRLGNPNVRGSDLSIWTGGRFSAQTPVWKLIQFAYDIQRNQIEGLPSWAKSREYTIQAVPPPGTPKLIGYQKRQMVEQMVRSLLADRFALRVHLATKQLPVYEIVVAKGGPKLGPVSKADFVKAGRVYGAEDRDVHSRPGRINALGDPVSGLARELSIYLGRTVIDRTALTGRYDFNLTWTPWRSKTNRMSTRAEPSGNGEPATGMAGAPGSSNSSNPSAPSIFTAIQQQLGLKLKPAKGPVEVLVIDHVEPPTPN